MQDILYYPLSIKRLGRLGYLLFYFVSGSGLIYFSWVHKNALMSLIGAFYFVWGAVFILASVLLSIPYIYKKVHLAINKHGVFQKISFFKKIQFAKWEDVREVKVIDTKVVFELENSKMYILTEKMNINDRKKIVNAIKFHVNAKK